MPRNPAPPEIITPDEAARRLGKTPNYVRLQLRKGTFPVGWADNPTGTKWTYCIPRVAFENLMSGSTGVDVERLASLVAAKVVEQLKGGMTP